VVVSQSVGAASSTTYSVTFTGAAVGGDVAQLVATNTALLHTPEVQHVTITAASGSFGLTFPPWGAGQAQSTSSDGLTLSSSAADVKTALQQEIGSIDNVDVTLLNSPQGTGSYGGVGYAVTFSGASVTGNVPLLSVITSNLGRTAEVQRITVIGTVGTWTLAYDGHSTDQGTPLQTNSEVGAIQPLLEDLPSIGPQQISVTGGVVSAHEAVYDVTFYGDNVTGDLQLMTATNINLEGQSEIQSVMLSCQTGGTFALAFGDETTEAIAWNAANTTVQSALESLPSVNSVEVNKNVESLSCPLTTYTVTFADEIGDVSQIALANVLLVGPTKEIQSVSVRATSGTFTLTFGFQTTAPLTASNSYPTASQVQAALEALSNIGAGGVVVTVGGGAQRRRLLGELKTYSVTFVSGVVSGDVDQLVVTDVSLERVQEVQTVTVEGTSGYFKLVFGTETTASINAPATAAAVESALELLTAVDDVVVSSAAVAGATVYSVTFTGRNVRGDVGQITVDVGKVDEVQTVTMIADGGDFTLQFGGFTTELITSYSATAADVRSALEGLNGIVPGDVAVTLIQSGSCTKIFSITFTGLTQGNVAPLVANGGSLYLEGCSDSGASDLTVATVTEGVPSTLTGVEQAEVQSLTTVASGGDMFLSFGSELTSFIGAGPSTTATVVQEKLEALPSIGTGGVVVTKTTMGDCTSTYSITFRGLTAATRGNVENQIEVTACNVQGSCLDPAVSQCTEATSGPTLNTATLTAGSTVRIASATTTTGTAPEVSTTTPQNGVAATHSTDTTQPGIAPSVSVAATTEGTAAVNASVATTTVGVAPTVSAATTQPGVATRRGTATHTVVIEAVAVSFFYLPLNLTRIMLTI
jgi:hypothetical protein